MVFGTTGVCHLHRNRVSRVALVGILAIGTKLCCVVSEGQESSITNQAPNCPPGSHQWWNNYTIVKNFVFECGAKTA